MPVPLSYLKFGMLMKESVESSFWPKQESLKVPTKSYITPRFLKDPEKSIQEI